MKEAKADTFDQSIEMVISWKPLSIRTRWVPLALEPTKSRGRNNVVLHSYDLEPIRIFRRISPVNISRSQQDHTYGKRLSGNDDKFNCRKSFLRRKRCGPRLWINFPMSENDDLIEPLSDGRKSKKT